MPHTHNGLIGWQDEGMNRDGSNVELQKRETRNSWRTNGKTNSPPPGTKILTVKSTKYFWLFSPTQLLTQGQWWSIFRIHLRKILGDNWGRMLHFKFLRLHFSTSRILPFAVESSVTRYSTPNSTLSPYHCEYRSFLLVIMNSLS